MTRDDVTPMNGWVLVLPDAPTPTSGIIIPTSATNYGHTCGVVIRASDTYYPKGHDTTHIAKMPVSEGDRVVCRDYLKELETVELACGVCCFIYVEDILCVVEEGVVVA